MARQRRTYTSEFKVEAVKLVTVQGYSLAQAARSLGIGRAEERAEVRVVGKVTHEGANRADMQVEALGQLIVPLVAFCGCRMLSYSGLLGQALPFIVDDHGRTVGPLLRPRLVRDLDIRQKRPSRIAIAP